MSQVTLSIPLPENNAETLTKDDVPQIPPAPTVVKKPRGFAAMSPERVTEIARKGGKAAQAKGVAHQWTQEEARQAGRKGGRVTGERRSKVVS